MRSVENAECRNCPIFNFQFPFPIPHSHFSNVHAGCRRRGVCNMEINKSSLIPFGSL